METFEISEQKWTDWEELYSGETLTYNRAKGVVVYEGKSYVITGLHWGGERNLLMANEVVPFEKWDGPTRTYGEDMFEPTSYKGQRFACKGQAWVLTGNKVSFAPIKVPEFKQKGLF
jgi:hypothetical protein